MLIDPARSTWYWLGEPWVAEELWFEYGKDCYRLKNAEFFNQQSFSYIWRTEENLLKDLAQSAIQSLSKRLNIEYLYGIWGRTQDMKRDKDE